MLIRCSESSEDMIALYADNQPAKSMMKSCTGPVMDICEDEASEKRKHELNMQIMQIITGSVLVLVC